MMKAKEILGDPYSKSYEAAYKVGYDDYPHFSKAFKKHFGMSPSEYRKKQVNES
jgi:two-component system, response regulator YesN